MNKIIVVCALKDEFVNLTKLPLEIVYTGIGKVNAAYKTTKAIYDIAPKLIINVGTAGAVNKNCHGLLEITKVMQRDMLAEPFAIRGVTPYSEYPSVYYSAGTETENNKNKNPIVCGTGDSFVTSVDPWFLENNIDIVDMELYAIATIAYRCNIPWRSFKFISDEANSAAGKKWQEHVSMGIQAFNTAIKKIL